MAFSRASSTGRTFAPEHDSKSQGFGHDEKYGLSPVTRDAVTQWMLRIRGIERVAQRRAGACPVAAQPLETFFVRPFPRWKRALDVAGASFCIVLSAPLMLLIALAVRLTSRGPVIFAQERGGCGGRPFKAYKFRSMVADAEERKHELLQFNERKGPAFKMKDDPRVTRVGSVIRCLSLDELPQLFNVLRGDMSLVGPRPLPVAEDREYALWQRARLATKPGITWLWQVTSRDKSCFDHWVRLDLQYIENMSFWQDVRILLLTVPAVLSRRGAH